MSNVEMFQRALLGLVTGKDIDAALADVAGAIAGAHAAPGCAIATIEDSSEKPCLRASSGEPGPVPWASAALERAAKLKSAEPIDGTDAPEPPGAYAVLGCQMACGSGIIGSVAIFDGPERRLDHWDRALLSEQAQMLGSVLAVALEKQTTRPQPEPGGGTPPVLRNRPALDELASFMADFVPAAIMITEGAEHRLTMVNGALAGVLGTGKEQLLGKRVVEAFPGKLGQVISKAAGRVLRTGRDAQGIDLPIRMGDDVRYWTFALRPMQRSGGRPGGVLGVGLETTDQVKARRRIEQMADEAESMAARASAIISSIADGVFVAGAGVQHASVNEAGWRMAGASSAEEMRRSLEDDNRALRMRQVDGSPLPVNEMALARALQGETFSDFEALWRLPDGREVQVQASGAPVRDKNGQVELGVAVFRDVTKSRREERNNRILADLSERLNATLDPDAVIRGVAEILVASTADASVFMGLHQDELRPLDIRHRSADRQERLAHLLTDAVVKVGNGVCGQAACIGKHLLLNDLSPSSATGRFREIYDEFEVHSAIAVPVRWQSDILGVITLWRTGDSPPFDDLDLSLAQAVADRTAASLKSAHLYTEVERKASQLATVIESSVDGMVVYDRSGAPIIVNSAAFRLLGPEIGELLDDGAGSGLDIYDPDGNRVTRGALPEARSLRGERIVGIELDLRRPDGTVTHLQCSAAPLIEASGQTGGAVVTYRDLTELRLAVSREVELRQRLTVEQMMRESMLHNVPAAMAVLSEPGHRYVRTNGAYRRLFDANGAAGRSLLDASPAAAGSKLVTMLDEVYATGKAFTAVDQELDLGPVGKRYCTLTCWTIRDPDGTVSHIMLCIIDTTTQVLARQELDRLKDEFVSVASHELRTPLTSIKGYTQFILKGAVDQQCAGCVRRLRTIDDQANRMTSLITKLLDASRIQLDKLDLHVQRTDLVRLAGEVVRQFQTTYPDRDIVLDAGGEIVGDWDTGYIKQVLVNLIENAVKYSASVVRVGIHVNQAGDQAEVIVTDSGPGIPAAAQAGLFARFYRAQHNKVLGIEGLGLGLYICRRIVEEHGGRIHFETVEGQGSVFRFTLPLSAS